MELVNIVDHPLIQHKLSLLRDKNTTVIQFRTLANELGQLLAYEATRDLPLQYIPIETPMEKMDSPMLSGKKTCVISILRAGNGMLDGVLQLLPASKVGFIGLERDKQTHLPKLYYANLPNALDERSVIVIDPMLATGLSAVECLNHLKVCGAKSIKFLCLVAAPQGIEMLKKTHSDVAIYTAAIDRDLDDNAYILPGLGDAGDRIYGTI